MDNPLKLALLDELKKTNEPLKIHELFSQVKALIDGLVEEHLSMDEKTFRQNFVIMNALYQLQEELYAEKVYLSITTMSICLYPVVDNEINQHLETDRQLTLKAYYLDWANYHQTTENEIKLLFDSFWQRFFNEDKRLSSLQTLGLTEPATIRDIKKCYRQKIANVHPDKGGKASSFIEIREAYEVLKQIYSD